MLSDLQFLDTSFSAIRYTSEFSGRAESFWHLPDRQSGVGMAGLSRMTHDPIHFLNDFKIIPQKLSFRIQLQKCKYISNVLIMLTLYYRK